MNTCKNEVIWQGQANKFACIVNGELKLHYDGQNLAVKQNSNVKENILRFLSLSKFCGVCLKLLKGVITYNSLLLGNFINKFRSNRVSTPELVSGES